MNKSDEFKRLRKELSTLEFDIRCAIMAGKKEEAEELRLRHDEIKKLIAKEMLRTIKEENEQERGRR